MEGWRERLRRCVGGIASVAAIAFGTAVPAAAATIEVETTRIDGNEVSFIIVAGELEYGDELRFADLAIRLPEAAVLFSSPGGSLQAGIEIGKAIRLKGFATMAGDAYSCASACALAWLGGSPRFMSEDYAVGFHAATLADDPVRAADSVGNALVGAYLNQLGMMPRAIAYMTEAQPDGMQWLSFADAEAVGIEVGALSPVDPGPEAEVPSGTGPEDFASYGDWIQLYSRQSLNLAIEVGMAYQREFPGTFVFRYDNGWYVVAIGPFPPGTARREKDRLVATGRIPRDSLVNRGERFLDLVWGASETRPAVSERPRGEDVALAAAEEFFAAISGSATTALSYLARVYPPQVRYFGRPTARSEVLREKQEFVVRWPERRYVLREGAKVTCRPDGDCIVDGLVDWRNYSAPRKASSVGTARFTLVFRPRGGDIALVGEESTIVTRNVRQGR